MYATKYIKKTWLISFLTSLQKILKILINLAHCYIGNKHQRELQRVVMIRFLCQI